jgi:DNA-directed RNA polymerase II subunit RPB1
MGYLPLLKSILGCICIKCNKLLVYKNENEIAKILKNKHGKQRFAEIKAICKGITHCQKENYGCGAPVHKITVEKKYGNVYLLAEPVRKNGDIEEAGETKKRIKQSLTPQLCYDILRAVSDEDFMIMGFDPKKSRPEDMIIVNFPVPPVQVRPSIRMEILSSHTMDDDLTHKIIDIIKSNESLKNIKGDGSLSKSATLHDDFMFLQFHVATFFANNIMGLPRSQQKNKKPTKSLSERLKGKEGRVRGNLMGKRVDMSGRTVITSDPNIALNQVGIPLIIAKNLTYPEIVTKHNIEYMRQLVKNGSKKYPGANYVIKNVIDSEGNESKHIYHLKYVGKPVPIKPGDIVERHLVTGDMVLFNRQPSLHKLSMMGHECHVINNPSYLTFRVNVSVTAPYNADFDGDEMNIHVAQSIQTVTELRLIANATKRIVSPTTSKIIINAKQDTLMGSYVLTHDNIRIDWKDAMNILMRTKLGINHEIHKHKLLSGKYLYSKIIPKTLNVVKWKDSGNYQIRIHNGIITDGIFGKPEIAFVVQKIWTKYSNQTTQDFIDDLQRMILHFLMNHGFTLGIKDTIMSKKVYTSIKKVIETKRKEVAGAITEYENDPYVMTSEAFEISIRENLRSIQGDIEKIVMNNFAPDNGIFICISSGSSGTSLNAGQIIGCVGQTIVEGKRIQKKFNNRTLPMFFQHDDNALARGFCSNSFISGLNPMELFFHVMAGREGVINAAIKTAETGYVQRKLIKILEDIKVEYDGTVRNANEKIIQYVYGDNGINVEKQIEQKIDLVLANNKTIREKYIYTEDEITVLINNYGASKQYTSELNEKLYRKLINMRDKIRKSQKSINVSPIEIREIYMVPVDINQIVMDIISRENRNTKKLVDPYYVLSKIRELYNGQYNKIMKFDSNKSTIKKADEHRIKFSFKFYLYDVLVPKKCTHVYKLSKKEFDEIIENCQKYIPLARVEGGEMVGFVGAQSIGEPVTQTNLKSFQKSGTGKTVTGGLMRIKELTSITKNIKTPIMEIILEDRYKNDRIVVDKIASYLKYTTLKDIVKRVDICYDPEPYSENSIMNKDEVTNIFEGKEKMGCVNEIQNLPWILRLVLSKEKMIERNVTMLEIKTSFCQNWFMRHEESKGSLKEYKKVIEKVTQCAIVTNFDNSSVPIVHIRFNANNYNFNVLLQFQEMIINRYKIKGIPNIIESNNIIEESYKIFDEEGNMINKKQYVIITDGVNLDEIAQINGINLRETRCNDIVTIYETYGVEAARSAFIREFTKAIGSSGGFSNYQHIELLADAITHMGGLIAVNRHGASKLDTDPFSRASFEKTVEQLLGAAAFGESDYIRSVSARIMAGMMINGGTGCFDLLLDHIKVKKYSISKKEKKIEKSEKSPVIKRKTTIDNLIKKKKLKQI